MKTKLVLLIGALLAASPLLSAAEDETPPPTGVRSFVFPDPEIDKKLSDSIFSEGVFDIASSSDSEPTDPSLADIWLTNHASIQVGIQELTISMTASAREGEETPQGYNLVVQFNPDSIVLRSDRPKLRALAGGLRVRIPSNKVIKTLLEGADDQSIGIAAPSIGDVNKQGVLLCPRSSNNEKAAKPGAEGTSLPEPLKFAPSSVRFSANARGDAYSLKGPGKSKASVLISTSSGISKAKKVYDEDFGKDATIQFAYEPTEEAAPVEFKTEPLVEGISVELDLANRPGYRRLTKVSDVVRVAVIPDAPGFKAVSQFSTAEIDHGPCISIVKTREWNEFYSKLEGLEVVSPSPSPTPTPEF